MINLNAGFAAVAGLSAIALGLTATLCSVTFKLNEQIDQLPEKVSKELQTITFPAQHEPISAPNKALEKVLESLGATSETLNDPKKQGPYTGPTFDF